MSDPVNAPLLPKEDVREAALFFVVTALCFLAAISALAARSAYGAAKDWTSEVEGEITVRLDDTSPNSVRQAVTLIEQTRGVAEAVLIERDDAEALLRPWFGSNLPADLPLPVLVAVSSEPLATNVETRIEKRLTDAGITSRIDAHEQWADDLERALNTVRLSALGAVILLSTIAISVIAFATHAALLARRDIVDVLHLAGARDGYIASLFQQRFFGLGWKAGAVGALLALGAISLVFVYARQSSERAWLLPDMSLDIFDGAILIMTPILAGFAAMYAARLTVIRALSAQI